MNFLFAPSTQNALDTFNLYARLATLFNTHYRVQLEALNVKNQTAQPALLYSQFLPVKYKFDNSKIQIFAWELDNKILKKFGLCRFANKKQHTHRFYLPEFLLEHNRHLLKELPPADDIITAHLLPSGRTLAFYDAKAENPFISIKVNTAGTSAPSKYISKKLSRPDIKHSIRVSDHLKKINYIWPEVAGVAVYSGSKAEPTYGYVLRSFDFKHCKIGRKDFVIPLVAFLSESFWADEPLLKSLNLRRSELETYLLKQFPQCLSEILYDSHFKTFVHLELHQQNLSLQIRDGAIIRVLYHDVLDSVFDPLTYFFSSVANRPLPEIHSNILKLSKDSLFNCHGEIKNSDRVFSDFTAVNIYSRYLRNLGDYEGCISALLQSTFRSCGFETAVMNAFAQRLKTHRIQFIFETPSLFHFIQKLQNECLLQAIQKFKNTNQAHTFLVQTQPTEFIKKLKKQKGFVTAFLQDPLSIKPELFSEIFYDSKFCYYFGTYDKKSFVALFV